MRGAADALGPGGPVSRILENFNPRESQQTMAAAVERTIAERGVLVCEAGTGTGKTFAYLVPSLASGKRTLVSTGTKSLQDQIFGRDLPLVRKALGRGAAVALLKGRANYLCHHRLHAASERPQPRELRADLAAIRAWHPTTSTGDVAEVAAVAESSTVWPHVTSTADNCLGAGCAHYDECFVLRARRRALAADLVVVNHHLFFADLALREEGFAELLPEFDTVILDEAHLLPQIATQFFGLSLSSRQILGLADDVERADAEEAGDLPELRGMLDGLRRAARDLRAAFGPGTGRSALDAVRGQAPVSQALRVLGEALDGLGTALAPMAERGPALASGVQRLAELGGRLASILAGDGGLDRIAWLELYPQSLVLHSSPLEIDHRFGAHVAAHRAAWIFTSATLSIGGSCAHFAARLGLAGFEERCLPSPFDYERQWLGYVPAGLPDPRAEGFHDALAEAALPVLEASAGRAFFLFTSYRGLERTLARLRSRLRYPVLVQGEAPRDELLREFRRLGNAVLFGTSSFWQGVDVRGDALSCVIVDKLPFEAPGDPLLAARLQRLREAGVDPFATYQLPQAVIALKQGLGRLIRDERDRGVVVIGDGRILGRGYGRTFLASVPPLPLTRELGDVQAFFARAALEPLLAAARSPPSGAAG